MYGGKFAFQNQLGWLIVGRKFTIFAFFYFVFEGNFPSTSPQGAYIRRGDFTISQGVTSFGGGGAYIWRGLYMEGFIFGILRYVNLRNI